MSESPFHPRQGEEKESQVTTREMEWGSLGDGLYTDFLDAGLLGAASVHQATSSGWVWCVQRHTKGYYQRPPRVVKPRMGWSRTLPEAQAAACACAEKHLPKEEKEGDDSGKEGSRK